MTWFRVDDGFPRSRKVLSIPKRRRAAVVGVWVLAGAWAAGELTDGFVPRYALDEIPMGLQSVPDLVTAGLWIPVQKGSRVFPDGSPTDPQHLFDATPNVPRLIPDDGWLFKNWPGYQPSSEQVEKERADNAARQQAYRDRKQAERDAKRNALHNASRNGTVTAPRPDPTRPVVLPTEVLPSPSEKGDATPPTSRARAIRDTWKPSDQALSWASSKQYSLEFIELETEMFMAHFKSTGKPMKSWDDAWKTWLIRSWKQQANRPLRAVPGPRPSTTDARMQQAAEAKRSLDAKLNGQQHLQIEGTR